MSNGDDVLDNWEEIDEAGLYSSVQKLKNSSNSSATCERITKATYQNSSDTVTSANTKTINYTSAVSNIKQPIQMKLLQRTTNTQDSTTTTTTSTKSSPKSPLDDMSATFQPVMMVLHKPQDEYHSANYTPPIANQTVKILRRPTQTTEPRNNGIRPKLPLKTLQQREQEYAEARLRILGSAKNPEDDEQKTATITTTTPVPTPIINSTQSTPTAALINNPFTNLAVTNTKLNALKIQGGPNQYNNHYNQQLQNQQQQQQQQQQQPQYQQNYPTQPQQQQPQQSYFYNQQQQQQPQSPAYNNNNRTYGLNPLLGLGPMGAIGQPAQYQAPTLPSSQAQQQQQTTQQLLKYQQFHQKSSQLHHKSQQQQQQQQQQTWSPVVGGSVSSSSLRQPQNDTILRLPRGPDGTTGFQMRR